MNAEQQQKLLHDALVQEFIKRGELIEAGFVAMRATVIPPNAPQVQIDEMRLAYMAGAQHLFASIMSSLDPDKEPTEADMHRMSQISAELEAFAEVLKLRAAETGRAQ